MQAGARVEKAGCGAVGIFGTGKRATKWGSLQDTFGYGCLPAVCQLGTSYKVGFSQSESVENPYRQRDLKLMSSFFQQLTPM
jgi:hypothetical protein